MSMTMQEYIVRFGVEGLNNLDTAILGMDKLDTAVVKSSSSLTSTLSAAARDAGVSFNTLGEVIGTKTVRSFAQFEQGGTRVIGNIKQMQAAILQADGAIVKLNYNMQRTGNGMYTYMGGTGSASSVSSNTANSMVPGAGQTSAVSSALALAGRAALTIPIWMALRSAMTSVSETATEGVKRMEELDKAVAQMSILTTGAFNPTAAKKSVDELSLSTGKSVEEIRDVYKNLAESGLSSSVSLEAMTTVVKGSMASFSEAAPLARTLAGALNVMGSSIDVGTTQAEKLNYMMNVMQTVWKDNGGQMDDYVGGLRNSAAAAQAAGVSFKELMVNLATMHTALQMGSVAGNALRMALTDLTKNQPKVLTFLGESALTPDQAKDSENLLMAVVQKMRTMQESGVSNSVVLSTVNALFGQKGGRDPLSLLALLDKYKQNMADVNAVSNTSNVFGKDADSQINTMTVQFDRMHAIIADMGANFLGGLFNIDGKDPVEILKNMNTELSKMKDGAESFGKAIHDALLPLSILIGMPLLSAGANLSGFGGGAGMNGVRDNLEKFTLKSQLPAAMAAENATSNLGAAAYGVGAGGIGSWLARMAQPAAGVALGEGSSAIGGMAGFAAGALPAMVAAIITIAVPATLAYLTSLGLAKIPIGNDKNLGDLAGATMSDMWDSVRHPFGDQGVFGKNGIFSVSNNPNSAMEQVLNPTDPYAIPDWIKNKQQPPMSLLSGGTNGEGSSTQDNLVKAKDLTNEYDKMKQYGIDDLQIKEQVLADLQAQLQANLGINDTTELAREIEKEKLAIMQAQTAEINKYADTLQKSISTNLLDSLQNKKGTPGLFTSMSETITKQFQTNIADNASKLIMSSGVGSVSGGMFSALDDSTRAITDPILKAHTDGAAAVHNAILSAFGAATGKDFSGSMMSASGGGVTSSGGLSGIWGIQPFSNHTITGGTIGAPAGAAMSMIGPNGQQGYGDANGKWLGTGNSSQTSIGQLGQIASIGAGGAMMLSGGISQIQGGGAKNITSGIGSIAGSIGGTAGALGSMGAFGGMFAVGGGSVATGALGLLGPIGVALGAVAMIASLFMQSKSSSTQTQTSETKVASKIDLSNQKLELINKNLLALNNTMSTYALATSAYFSEKNGTIDSQFALAGNRAY